MAGPYKPFVVLAKMTRKSPVEVNSDVSIGVHIMLASVLALPAADVSNENASAFNSVLLAKSGNPFTVMVSVLLLGELAAAGIVRVPGHHEVNAVGTCCRNHRLRNGSRLIPI